MHAALANRWDVGVHRAVPMPDTAPPASASASGSSPPLPSPRGRQIEVQARNELVRIAYRDLKGDSLASAGAASAFALAMGMELPSPRVWGWLAFMVSLAA